MLAFAFEHKQYKLQPKRSYTQTLYPFKMSIVFVYNPATFLTFVIDCVSLKALGFFPRLCFVFSVYDRRLDDFITFLFRLPAALQKT